MLKKICNILLSLLIAGMAVIAAALLVPYLFGYRPLAVLSPSMEPTYPVGCVVYVNTKVKPEELKVGDAITFTLSGNTLATHRITAIDSEKREYVTQGDANNTSDGARSFDTLVGRVSRYGVPLLGYVSEGIKTTKGMVIAAGLVMIIILLAFLPDALAKDKKPANEAPEASSDTPTESLPEETDVSIK